MNQDELERAVLRLRAVIIARMARQHGVAIQSSEIEPFLRQHEHDAHVLRKVLSRVASHRQTLVGRVLKFLRLKS